MQISVRYLIFAPCLLELWKDEGRLISVSQWQVPRCVICFDRGAEEMTTLFCEEHTVRSNHRQVKLPGELSAVGRACHLIASKGS